MGKGRECCGSVFEMPCGKVRISALESAEVRVRFTLSLHSVDVLHAQQRLADSIEFGCPWEIVTPRSGKAL